MTAPRVEPLTESEEREWRKLTGSHAAGAGPVLDETPGWLAPWAVDRVWATLDAARAELAEVRAAWNRETVKVARRLRSLNEGGK
jgi:hypothetical protein